MSFFFSEKKHKPKPQRAAAAKPASANSSSKEMLRRLGCKACPLNTAQNYHPKMKPDLSDQDGGIYFLGDGVSDEADEKGEPFAGQCKKILQSLIGSRDHYSFDNVIRDFDDKKSQPSWVSMECCRQHIINSIEEVKPKLIIGFGIQTLQWMMNSSDMAGLRGRVFAVKIGKHACWFMPTYSPQYVIDNAYEGKDPLRSKLGHCLKFDLDRGLQLFKALPQAVIDTPEQARAGIQAFNGRTGGQLAQVLKLISEARKAPERAIDWETYPLRPYATDAKVLTCAISFGNVNFAFAIDHPKAGWKPHEKNQLKEALRHFLCSEGKIVAHNAPFEVEWAIHLLGKEAIIHEAWECTMMQAHFLDERRGKRGGNDEQFQPNPYQALDFLVRQHFGISYKSVFKVNRKRMDQADLEETLLYNGADTKYTLRLFRSQSQSLKQAKILNAYREAVERQPTVALMQSMGIDCDQQSNAKFGEKLNEEIRTITQRIHSVPEVKDYVAKYQNFNPASQPEVIRLLKDHIKVGKALINSEGKESVDKNTLAKIRHPIAKDIEEFRNRSKLKSTYVDPFTLGTGQFIWPDKKIHPSFNTTFAETGRTSCTAWWTPVLTARGEIPIRDVKVGDLVWTHKQRWKPVTALWRKGWEVMLRLKLSNGAILTCTKNHRLLSPNGHWVTAGDIYDLFQEMGSKKSKHRERLDVVPQQRNAISQRYRQKTTNDRSKRVVGNAQLFVERGVSSAKALAILDVQTGRQKSNEGFDRQQSTSMEGSHRRWAWIQNDKDKRKKNILPPLCGLEGVWYEEAPGSLGNTSHRRESTQQRTGQSGNCNKGGAQSYPCQNTSGFEIIAVEKIEVGRSCEVFDITVADDASYLTCGVISHNSDEPNQQNWPSRNDKWVRKQIIAPPGHVLVALDYGQLEGCTGAMCSKDKTFIKALWEDYDMHMEWALRAAHLWPDYVGGREFIKDKDVMKKFRGLIKNKMVFPAFFGAAKDSIAGYLTDATGIEAPPHVIDKLFNEFWKAFAGVYRWQKLLMDDYYEKGYVESPTGRRRHYPLGRPQAINYPIQSVACDIVCRAMVNLSKDAAETGRWYLHPIMNIHDDLTFCIPDKPQILEEAIEHIYKVMLTPAYSFINVPLSVTASIGNNWLEMDEIGKFWSHKDL